MAAFVVIGTLLLPAVAAADGKCRLGKYAEFAITMQGLRPLMTAAINGTDVRFALDSGAFFSMISPASAAELKLQTHFAPFGFDVRGVGGGSAEVSVATVKTFTLVGVPLKNVDFLVGGSDVGDGVVGLLGQNVLHIADVEYDLRNGVVRLMRPFDCGKTVLAYWAGSMPYAVIDIDPADGLNSHTGGYAEVNGHRVRVTFDTGAETSVLSLQAAARAGVKADSPGVVYDGTTYGVGKTTYETFIAPFGSFKIGDEEIKNARLRIGNLNLPDADMLLGADFFLSHRIYVANGQRKLYFTYNGGPVFNLAVKSADGMSTASENRTSSPPPTPPTSETGTAAPSHDAEAADSSRRGTAEAARGDLEHAIADLSRACELAPGNPQYFYQRGLALYENEQPELALSDFDRSISLSPNEVSVLLVRAQLLLQRGDTARAVVDLEAADAAASRESDFRFPLAGAFEEAERPDAAIRQYDLWIQFHAVDARYPAALNGRCWARALKGTDLPLALKDCKAARGRAQKASPLFAKVLNSTGLVLLRMGDYDGSAAEYTASLKINPKNAWSWYGRGIDEQHQHKPADSQTDMARAEALWPQVAEVFQRHGITP